MSLRHAYFGPEFISHSSPFQANLRSYRVLRVTMVSLVIEVTLLESIWIWGQVPGELTHLASRELAFLVPSTRLQCARGGVLEDVFSHQQLVGSSTTPLE